MTFRRAVAEDVPALLALHERFYREEGYPYDPISMARALRELIANPAFGRAFVTGDPPVGYLLVTFGFSVEFGGRDAFVDELYIADAARGQGLGSAALQVAEEACREAGIRALHLEVEHANSRARALYERSGYVAHDRHLMTKRFSSGATGS
ncbi:MAG TPA: GNAT family N-acetyltransferase [Thermoanaerobaculia bacterium]|nr:GNAT family N-acetyltransferase [Thermoanaerobaculia bacterium]